MNTAMRAGPLALAICHVWRGGAQAKLRAASTRQAGRTGQAGQAGWRR